MTTFEQFGAKAKMRHDFSDQIQVRYVHPNGEAFDTWISGEEVMERLNTQARERLIRSFSRKEWGQVRDEIRQAADKGEEMARRALKDKLADVVSDSLGDNIFGDTLADNIRGVDSNQDPYEREKQLWQERLRDQEFRAIALELAWINLDGVLPEEAGDETAGWI